VKQVRTILPPSTPQPSWGSCPRSGTAAAADEGQRNLPQTRKDRQVTFSPVPQPHDRVPERRSHRTRHWCLRQIDAGHSADHIAQVQEGAQGAFDDTQATLAQREWFAGYRDTAADILQTYRAVQLAEAELPASRRRKADMNGPAQGPRLRDDQMGMDLTNGTCDGRPACAKPRTAMSAGLPLTTTQAASLYHKFAACDRATEPLVKLVKGHGRAETEMKTTGAPRQSHRHGAEAG